MAVAERIPDGEDPVPDPDLVRVSQREVGEHLPVGFEPDHGQVRRRILPDDHRLQGSAVGELHLDAGGPVDDVVVGDDEPARVHDSAGSPAELCPRRRWRRREPEELFESRILRPAGALALHEQTHHSRRRHPRHFGEGVGEGPRRVGPVAVGSVGRRRDVRETLMAGPAAGVLLVRDPLTPRIRRGGREAREVGALGQTSGGRNQPREGKSGRQESKHERWPPWSGPASGLGNEYNAGRPMGFHRRGAGGPWR